MKHKTKLRLLVGAAVLVAGAASVAYVLLGIKPPPIFLVACVLLGVVAILTAIFTAMVDF